MRIIAAGEPLGFTEDIEYLDFLTSAPYFTRRQRLYKATVRAYWAMHRVWSAGFYQQRRIHG